MPPYVSPAVDARGVPTCRPECRGFFDSACAGAVAGKICVPKVVLMATRIKDLEGANEAWRRQASEVRRAMMLPIPDEGMP